MTRHRRDTRHVYVLSEHVGEVGGSAKSTVLLCESLVRLGRRVTLFLPQRPFPPVLRRLQTAGVKLVWPPVRFGSRWELPSRLTALMMSVAARLEEPSLVHCVSLSTLARHALRLPQAAPLWLWETTEALPHVKFVDARIAVYLDRAAGVLAPSVTIARNIRSTYRFTGPIRILPFWSDEPPCPEVAPRRSGQFVFIGRFDPDKGFAYLFDALERIRKAHPCARVTLYGHGDVEGLLRLAGGRPGIRVASALTGNDLHAALHECDAVVLPSLHEGYPLVLLEACGNGRPVVASAVGSIPEVYGGRACALLVPPADAEALAGAMDRLLSDDADAYRERCADALRLFREIGAQDAVDRRLFEVYRAIEAEPA